MDKGNGSFGLLHGDMAGNAWRTQDFALAVYIFCYFLVSFSFLAEFPFIHSDESWLSGLTRNMAEKGNPGVTESFFDLKPRYPHGIKILFHLLQMPMLALFGYHVFSFRLLSLFFGCVALILFYLLLKSIFAAKSRGGAHSGWHPPAGASAGYPFAGTVFLSLDVQFIYASHFARQEILLVCCIAACMLAVYKNRWPAAGLITGLSIGFHPNSFLIGAMCAAMLLPSGGNWIWRRGSGSLNRRRGGANRARSGEWKPLLGYAAIVSVFAGIFIAVSLSFDRQFFRHYWEYGSSEFDIGAPVTGKLMELPYFIGKIWYGVSGTYYVPDIRLELVLFALTAAAAAGLLLCGKWKGAPEKRENAAVKPDSTAVKPESLAAAALTVKGIIGMLTGMIVIGRYNQTSIIFLFPLFFVLILSVIDIAVDHAVAGAGIRKGGPAVQSSGYGSQAGAGGRKAAVAKSGLVLALAAAVAASGYINISPWLKFSYDEYLKEIAAAVTPGNKVLANLNCEYYFENGRLLDWRNLSYLQDAGLSVEDYIRKNRIEYIILSDEMDLIYSQRPVWNMIYGNLRYMEELRRFLERNCTLVHSFRDNVYGIRIVQYMDPGMDQKGNPDMEPGAGAGGRVNTGSVRSFTVQIFKVEDLS